MIKHRKYTRTRYEYAIQDPQGHRAFTLWFERRNPSLNAIYRLVVACLDDIRKATGSQDVTWNGDGTITAGTYTGSLTGRTLLESRGYAEE